MATLFLHLGSEGKNICFARGAVSQRGLIATNGHTEWLRLDRHCTFVSDRGFRYDRQVFLQAVHVLIQPNPQIQVVYQTTEVSEPSLSASEADWVDIQTVENQVVVGGNVAEPTIFDVQLTVDRSTTHLSLSLFPRERVYDVAIDAGSEASQLLIHLRGNEEGCQRHVILDGLRRHFGIPEGEYDQEDEDAHLYLSRFYWNSQNEDSQGSHFRLPNATSPLLFVTRRSDTNKQLLPAVKVHFLSSLTHKRTWSVHKIYQSILASFLMEALYQIAETNHHERVAVVVNMLVPNMLSQNDHAALAQAMNEFVQSTRFDELKPTGFDGYVEIRLVSESDASLLGYLEQQKKQQNGRYCVIDMGRGTTDISVVDVDAAKAIAISRLGFLGAGNVINQAIFQEAVLHFVPLDEYPSKLEALLRMEPAKLWSIEKAIERLKRLNDPSPNPDPTTPQLELDKIIQKIEGLKGIPTTYKMLNNAIDQLVTEVVKRVPDKIDIICLTGRAFLFPPLTKKMVAALSKRTKNIKFDAAKAKEVCLLGSLATRKLDASRIGVPIAYDCTKGFGKPMLKERMIRSVQSCKGWFSFEKISSSLKKCEKRLNGEEPIRKKEEVQSAHVAKVVDEDEVMRAGTPIRCFGSATRFRLGDVVYHADHLPNEGETRLFFDGVHFFIRTAESRYLLQKVMACPNDERFLADSLFPYGLQFDNQLISKGNPHINTQQS